MKRRKDSKFWAKATRTKYRAKQTVIAGVKFASKKEAMRYLVLRDMEKRGEIENLRLQVPFEIKINGVKVCKYVCDYQYEQDGKTITEDVKGMLTPVYRLKKKLMLACHGIEILET